MKTITVAQTFRASPSGATVETFEAGKTYDVPEVIADFAQKEGLLVGKPAEEKALVPPQNKMLRRAPRNK